MRRPLNGNGTPFVFQALGQTEEVFNTEDFGLDQTYAVTLFALQLVEGGGFIGTNILFSVLTENGEALPATDEGVALHSVSTLSTSNGVFDTQRPQIILDRFVMRGKQRLTVVGASYGGEPIHVFGWFERVGENEVPGNFRGLQPSNKLVSPFNMPFLHFLVPPGAGAPVKQTLHLLDSAEEHLDLLTIYVSANVLNAVNTDGACAVLLPGGVSLNIPLIGSPIANVKFRGPFVALEGIPMRPPSSGDDKIEIQVTPDTVAADIAVNAFGRFTRG